MKLTRKKRIELFSKLIEKEWSEYFINNIIQNFYWVSISFHNLSENINVTWDTVLQNPQIPWKYNSLSSNPNITYDIVKKHPDYEWNYDKLSSNPSIRWEDILSDFTKSWNWRKLSEKPGIPLSIIQSKFNQLNKYLLIKNPSVSISLIEANPYLDWDYQEIPSISILTFSELLRITKLWNLKLDEKHWSFISEQEYITWTIVADNITLPWNFNSLSRNPNIILAIIENYPEYAWSYRHFTYNKNCVFQDILDNPGYNWDWEYISEYIVNFEDYLNNLNLPFCNNSIQMNPNFTFSQLCKIPHLQRNINYISLNPSITLEDIRNNRGYAWDWFWLSGSYFKLDKKIFIQRKKREWMAAYQIQQFYWSHKLSPKYLFGRNEINKMYEENFTI